MSDGAAAGMAVPAPFPWFGGKSRAAPLAWDALADVHSYVEPFAGSLAILLGRPGGAGRIETVNDRDGMISNFWRAVAADPDAVAHHADWPVNETDLTARHLWLVNQRAALTERLQVDPEHHDAKIAGWWCWGICAWIGSGWCSGDGPWSSDGARWIDRREPGNAEMGINRHLPHLSSAGMGINRKLPHLGDAGMGIAAWFADLAERLRGVRVCCGDWTRVVTDASSGSRGEIVGVFLDPPYPDGFDPDGAYAGQAGDVRQLWADVTGWAAENGERPDRRIILAGYDGLWTPPPGWTARRWAARKGYADADANQNHRRESLWCSPACLPERAPGLFGGLRA